MEDDSFTKKRIKSYIETSFSVLCIVSLFFISVAIAIGFLKFIKEANINKRYEYSVNGKLGISKQCNEEHLVCIDSEGWAIKVDKFRKLNEEK